MAVVPVLVMLMVAPKPPVHWLLITYWILQLEPVGVDVGVIPCVGVAVGVAVGVVPTVGVGVTPLPGVRTSVVSE